MRFIGVIPARFASTRFPGKPLVLIHGKPMIQHVWERANQSQRVSSWYVATDHPHIALEVERFGGRAIMTSPDHPSGTDRCREVAQSVDEVFDAVINVQGDEPLIDPNQIDQLCSDLIQHQADMATLVIANPSWDDFQNPNRVKAVKDSAGRALYFSRSPIPHYRDPQDFVSFFKHLGMYAYTQEALLKTEAWPVSSLEKAESLEQLRWLENGMKIQITETQVETPSVDTPEDLAHIISLLS
jgi:3-deoxy-manno-octulosonate cytidylyltransferase (CMP-KDO synthetase)